ncbi:fimbria/pilus periplasmic chaperone [Pseudomonas sp. 1912-s]|uniref:fimbrial biogenesis chaperone n=1 Tax=Pseudomonas sp. 1912-s TaxID=3033802 RepID=UPI0023E03B9E|nr:fimbria/pilus periplasmic chaperone [Pseudomonas sp. 1912-s]MDF3201801.1 fimbria/pilus periplasmic chaperone [Pseudomonas sp. 1912-s]
MLYRNPIPYSAFALLTMMVCSYANAGVVITGTRLVYPAAQQEITVKLNNNGSKPVLVQSWIDGGDLTSSPSNAKAPFVLTPPVARIDPNKGQSLRMMFSGPPQPSDRESVYWLNVLEIPPKVQDDTETNVLQMAFRSRIKIFYRPDNLPGTATEAIEQVQWKIVLINQGKSYALQAYNPSAYHVSQIALTLVDGVTREPSEDGMIDPGQTRQFPLPTLKKPPSSSAVVEFSAINDYGALVATRKPLVP